MSSVINRLLTIDARNETLVVSFVFIIDNIFFNLINSMESTVEEGCRNNHIGQRKARFRDPLTYYFFNYENWSIIIVFDMSVAATRRPFRSAAGTRRRAARWCHDRSVYLLVSDRSGDFISE